MMARAPAHVSAHASAHAPTREGDIATIASLGDALRSEARLIIALVHVMRRQRDAVAADDLDGVGGTVFDTHRVLLTLGEARRRRRALNQILGERDDLSLAALEHFFRGAPPAIVREAAEELSDAARTLRLEVDVNRRILHHASESSEHAAEVEAEGLVMAASGPAGGAERASRA